MSYTQQSAKAIKVFYSYSHKDEDFRKDLEKHLIILKRQGIIESWYDREIKAGNDWEDEITKRLNTADIILLLISSDFLASDYCVDAEVERAMERHEANLARVIPVILRACEWTYAPFGKLQALPKNALPVMEWSNRDRAILDIVKEIRKIAEEMIASSSEEKNLLTPTSRYAKPQIPDKRRNLLPCLCDRGEQISDLVVAIHNRQHHRPFIYVVHGDEQECPDMFQERLVYESLPEILNLKIDHDLKDKPMAWPSRYKPDSDPLDLFRYGLAKVLPFDSRDSKKQMANKLANVEDPVVICTNVVTANWKPAGRELIESFIKLWSEWPDLLPGKILIICLIFTYEQGKERDYLSRQRLRWHNKKSRSFFEQPDFFEPHNLSGVVLPELCAIKRNDVEHWVNAHACYLRGGELKKGECFRRIGSIFASRKAIEMEELVPHLRTMIG